MFTNTAVEPDHSKGECFYPRLPTNGRAPARFPERVIAGEDSEAAAAGSGPPLSSQGIGGHPLPHQQAAGLPLLIKQENPTAIG